MTPEKQRITIAEACGWGIRQEPNGEWALVRPDGQVDCSDWEKSWHSYRLPDYLSDLNAMHEAEKTLPPYKIIYYERELDRIVPVGQILCTATAAQRAEAFLRTIGKWEGS